MGRRMRVLTLYAKKETNIRQARTGGQKKKNFWNQSQFLVLRRRRGFGEIPEKGQTKKTPGANTVRKRGKERENNGDLDRLK